MSSAELERLVRVGQLKREPPTEGEVEGLRRSGERRLADARRGDLSLESRFDLAYNGAHALALAALRGLGYRSDSRYLVFQLLPHSLGLGSEVWRVLAKAHEVRNRSEYEGWSDLNERLVLDLITAASTLRDAVARGDG